MNEKLVFEKIKKIDKCLDRLINKKKERELKSVKLEIKKQKWMLNLKACALLGPNYLFHLLIFPGSCPKLPATVIIFFLVCIQHLKLYLHLT